MSVTLEQAAEALNGKLDAGEFDSTAKFQIEGLGAIMLDGAGARVGDEEADVTMTADADTFQSILDGELNPTAAFMSGKLTIDGDMGAAMKLASALA
ncbi:SCP2 sterol-binding domain-containing protein [Leisingera caerulea]|uniref:SCP2 sterol-binding domain-containing protein n=1 Tax=Leisingera caerulea TaxID=506591 RepID=A0ABY5WSW3_LEICA|nr:SCP2 sterol-binding domain-containing protein [Leisingera caerulea]UWQ48669.1 SCP2 sterol-binding domain-containing protein [Leisingera caerulea]UWQ57309.1 SCP2 sterol-binding domain-containing protein [Leisingera caerulea]UWQ82429.1 SCP2 sterol-binding domain-containing protein [Leisingera caerulea]